MRLKYKFVYQEVSGSFVAAAVGNDASKFSGLLRMNHVGRDILEQLEKEITEEEVVCALAEKYDADKEQIRASVSKFVKSLMDAGILE